MGISNLKSEFNQIPNLFSVLEDLRKKPFIIVSICDQAIIIWQEFRTASNCKHEEQDRSTCLQKLHWAEKSYVREHQQQIVISKQFMSCTINVSSAVYKYESLLQQRMNKMGRSTSKLTILLTFASLLFYCLYFILFSSALNSSICHLFFFSI